MARDGPDEVGAGPNDNSGSMRFIRWAMGSYQKCLSKRVTCSKARERRSFSLLLGKWIGKGDLEAGGPEKGHSVQKSYKECMKWAGKEWRGQISGSLICRIDGAGFWQVEGV